MNDNLRHGLSSLPAPRNDFEIVIPENMESEQTEKCDDNNFVEDQADIDNRMTEEIARKRMCSLEKYRTLFFITDNNNSIMPHFRS